MLEPRIVAMSVSRFAETVAPADMGEAEAANDATLRAQVERSWRDSIEALTRADTDPTTS